jgi:hypothetical protein
VLDTDIDPLWQNPNSNTLVDNNTNSPGGDVVNATGPSLVELVGHTLVNSTINLDVHNISDLVGLQVSRQLDRTIGAELLGEQMASARAVSLCVTHSNFNNERFIMVPPKILLNPSEGLFESEIYNNNNNK